MSVIKCLGFASGMAFNGALLGMNVHTYQLPDIKEFNPKPGVVYTAVVIKKTELEVLSSLGLTRLLKNMTYELELENLSNDSIKKAIKGDSWNKENSIIYWASVGSYFCMNYFWAKKIWSSAFFANQRVLAVPAGVFSYVVGLLAVDCFDSGAETLLDKSFGPFKSHKIAKNRTGFKFSDDPNPYPSWMSFWNEICLVDIKEKEPALPTE